MAAERLNLELAGAFRNVHADIERIEILAAALHAFSVPVPDYEPRFRHLAPAQLDDYELDAADK